MNRRRLNILLIAFVIAAGCSYLVFRLVGSRLSGSRQTTTHVIAAATDLKLGTVLRDADLTTIEIAGAVPKGAILRKEDAVGRGVISNLYLGEPIQESRLAAPGSGGGLAATIPQGMRASAVKVNDVVGVAGFVTPGMRVDVLITGTPPGANATQGPVVRTLLQNIEVLSAGTDIQRDAEGKPQQVQVVNLLVTPDQAELLSLASNETHIQLVLRNPLDTKVDKPSGSGMAQLFTDVKPPKPVVNAGAPRAPKPVPASRSYLVEVFNGSKKTETKFASGEEKQ